MQTPILLGKAMKIDKRFLIETLILDFPGGAVVRIHLPMQGTRVRTLVREDPTCRGATKPVATATEARTPRARVPQQEKPPQ